MPKFSEPNPWIPAVCALFATIADEIAECSIHSKLLLSDSGKVFAAVKSAAENYRYYMRDKQHGLFVNLCCVMSNLVMHESNIRIGLCAGIHQCFSADVAILVQLLNSLTSDQVLPTVQNAHDLLIMCLTEQAGQWKRKSKLVSWVVWLYHTDSAFTNPDRFQHACVHAKYAFKCAAFTHMKLFKSAAQDQKFVESHFRFADCECISRVGNFDD